MSNTFSAENNSNSVKFCPSCGEDNIKQLASSSYSCRTCGSRWLIEEAEDMDDEEFYNDFEESADEFEDYTEEEYYFSEIGDTCDWCGSPHVVYRDEAFCLCENCSDQLHGF